MIRNGIPIRPISHLRQGWAKVWEPVPFNLALLLPQNNIPTNHIDFFYSFSSISLLISHVYSLSLSNPQPISTLDWFYHTLATTNPSTATTPIFTFDIPSPIPYLNSIWEMKYFENSYSQVSVYPDKGKGMNLLEWERQ